MRLEHWLYTIPLRLRSILWRARVEQELSEELQFHLEQRIAQGIALGKSPEEARRRALRAMEGIEQQKEACRDMRGLNHLDGLARDFVQSLRWLRKNPLFTVAVTAILALGIGANTAIFSIVDEALLKPPPYESPGQLIRIQQSDTKRSPGLIRAPNYLPWRDRSDLFEKTVPYKKAVVTLIGGRQPDQFFALRASSELFSLLGVRARLGRTLVASDDAFNTSKVAVLSHRLWQRQFDADPDVVGKVVTVNDEAVTVVGVMGPEFEFPNSTVEMWLPPRLTAEENYWVDVVARMKEGVSAAHIQNAMEIISRQLEQEDPEKNADINLVVSPWRQDVEPQYELTLVLILVAVGLVLLIACADVASLLLSRAVQRQKEIAIRVALGAGFRRVMRQLLVESFVLAALGSIAGLALAHYALRYLSQRLAALPIILPRIQHVDLDGRALVVSVVLCLLVAGFCSLAPMLFASRTDLQTVFRGTQGTAPRGSARLFNFLVASQGAFAILLLVGSGLMIRSVIRLQEADKGFRPDGVLAIPMPVGALAGPLPAKYQTMPQQVAYYDELLERVARVPAVDEVALVNNPPLSRINTSLTIPTPDGRGVLARIVSSRYFAAMGIPLLSGRLFSDADHSGAAPVAIINEYLARQLFPNRDPLGQFLPGATAEKGLTVIGVVKNSWLARYDQPMQGEIYLPYRQLVLWGFASTLIVKTKSDPALIADLIRQEVWEVDPEQPVLNVETMNDVVANSIWRPRFSAWIFSVLGGLALLLTSAGVYGVVAYTTAQRMRDVGIRIALGASPGKVVAAVLWDSMMPLAAGLAIGVAVTLPLTRLLGSLLYEIPSTDPVAYLGAGALLLAIGILASARPAWRAAACEPLSVLRTE